MNDTCQGVKMLSPATFYPIPWESHRSFFTVSDELPDLMTSLDGAVLGAHVWNKLNAENPVSKKLQDRQLFANLAVTNCPKVFEAAPDLF